MKYIYFSIILVFFISCYSSKKEDAKTNQTGSKKNDAKVLYNINIDSLYVVKKRVEKGENVGEILNKNNTSFSKIDKIAKLSKKKFDLRDVIAGSNYTLLFSA